METQAPDGMVIADDILESQHARVLAELDEIAPTTKKALAQVGQFAAVQRHGI